MAFSSPGRTGTPLGIPLGSETFSGSVLRIMLRSTDVRDLAAYRAQRQRAHRLQPDPGLVMGASGRGAGLRGDLAEVLHFSEALAAEFGQDPELAPHVIELPKVIGPVDLADSAVTVRVKVKAERGEQWDNSRPFERPIAAVSNREGIELPCPRQDVALHSLRPRGRESDEGLLAQTHHPCQQGPDRL